MPILSRLKYAIVVLIAITMVLMLTLSIGEALGVVRGLDIQGLTSNPFYFLPVFALGYALAPALSERMPVSGDHPDPQHMAKARYGYTARTLLLVVGGLILVTLVNLAMFVFGKLQ